MANVVSVKLTWDNGKLTDVQRAVNRGLLRMGFDIASRARSNAPVLTGALRNSIRVSPENDVVNILAGGRVGGFVIDYAKLREYVNHLHPSTTHYMGRAFDSVVNSDWQEKYFGDITK